MCQDRDVFYIVPSRHPVCASAASAVRNRSLKDERERLSGCIALSECSLGTLHSEPRQQGVLARRTEETRCWAKLKLTAGVQLSPDGRRRRTKPLASAVQRRAHEQPKSSFTIAFTSQCSCCLEKQHTAVARQGKSWGSALPHTFAVLYSMQLERSEKDARKKKTFLK